MDYQQILQNKIISGENLQRKINIWKFKDDVIAFTNGCFDILHHGHFSLLAFAQSNADRLVVGLNSDESVKKLKGENRPIINQDERAFALASLHVVDAVVIFDEETPENLIQTVMPHVLIKGSDWSKDNIVGADAVEAAGGKVLQFELKENKSTTNIIQKIKDI